MFNKVPPELCVFRLPFLLLENKNTQFFFTFIAGDQGKHTKIVWLGCYRSLCRQLRITGLMNIAVLVLTNGHTFEKTNPKNT